ncbi:MAG: phage minor head protein [Bradyrhizobium sp.]|nr:phage minor head protein [Bradyrhizobium sp.]
MQAYAQRLDPWADSVADRMVKEIAAADREAWRRTSTLIGRLLHKEIETAPTGAVMRDSLDRQVTLIKSLPLEAAERVHKLTMEGMVEGRRTNDIAKEIVRSGDVCRSRADLIARTEVSRTATELTKARATHIGSSQFIWRTVHDQSVRASHRALDGKVFSWDDPPECDPGYHALPGGIWNCRCYPEPIIEEG